MRPSTPLWSPSITPRFVKALPQRWRVHHARLGLAISGGVDSMALASLCKEAANTHGFPASFIGFIVDHKLRKGSTEEACHVAEELRRLQIESRILTLDWRHECDHLEHTARKLRYRALGQACREHGINSLLVAHHADDQAETVLMRMVNKYFGSGLTGIAFERPIPECNDMYGVHRSGMARPVRNASSESVKSSSAMVLEDGGVSIIRPLLSFTKDELIAHCKSANVRWVEDQTNADPTFTLRNTVRYLQRRELLPVALRKQRLLTLAAQTAAREAEVEKSAQKAYERMAVTLDLRTDTATFDALTFEKGVEVVSARTRNVRAALLRKLLNLVAPTGEIKLQDLYRTTGLMWPDRKLEEAGQMPLIPTKAIQVAGVNVSCSLEGAQGRTWTMTRQLLARRKAPFKCTMLSSALNGHQGVNTAFRSSAWHLWDERYWIRLYQRLPTEQLAQRQDIMIRFLRQDDIANLMKGLERSERGHLRTLLDLAPGMRRFTLPALVASPPDMNAQQVVALPSLGWSADGWAGWSSEKSLEHDAEAAWFWDLRYKQVDIRQGGNHRIIAEFPVLRSSRDRAV